MIAGRNINNLRYPDDTTLTAESKEELMSLLMKVKEETEKADLKLNIQKIKIMASGPITSWQIESAGGQPCQGSLAWFYPFRVGPFDFLIIDGSFRAPVAFG